jgi:hypothetical protein
MERTKRSREKIKMRLKKNKAENRRKKQGKN